MIAAESAR